MKAILLAALAVASVPAFAKPQPKAPAPAAKKAVVAEAPKAPKAAEVAPVAEVAEVVAPVVDAPAARPVALADMPLEQLTNTVLAGTAAKPDKATAKAPAGDAMTALDMGGEYGLKKRQMALPTPDIDIEQFTAKSLDENQVGAIVRERAEDLEYCWLRLPQSKRTVSAAILHLEIEASGKVAAVEVNGDLPAGVGKCITQMAGRWSFPAADAATAIDHGIMLTTTSQKVR